MSVFHLKSVSYQKYAHPFTQSLKPVEETMEETAKKLSSQITKTVEMVPPEERDEISEHCICSTTISMSLRTGQLTWEDAQKLLKQHLSSNVPEIFINAYECTGWGFALRSYLQLRPDVRYLIVTILDINVYNFGYWVWNEKWEHTGFGATVLLLEKTGEITDELLVGSAKNHDKATIEFATLVRRVMGQKKHCRLALPFFAKEFRDVLESLLTNVDKMPDTHSHWGHCFGSDPWISIAENYYPKCQQAQSVLACSYSLNGYYCMLELEVTPETHIELIDCKPAVNL